MSEEFYTVTGDKITREYLVQKMIDEFNTKYPDAGITDFNEGSVIRNILESLSVDIYHLEYNDNLLLRQAFLTTATGYYLDLFGEEMNTPRLTGLQAQGEVTFSITESVNYLITIPQHTRFVETATGLYYETWTTCEIPIGETSVDCPVYSVVPGAGTNIPSNRDFLFYDQNSFTEVTITNSNAFTGGRDNESDKDYRNRLLDKKSEDGFGSLDYYKKLGKNISGVHDIAIVDSENNYTGKVLVNGYEKPLDEDILLNVTAVYNIESNLVYNQTFEVVEVDYTVLDFEIVCGVTDEVEEQLFIDALANFINGGVVNIANTQMSAKGCVINESLTNYQLLTMLETLPFVVQVTSLTNDSSTFNKLTPDADSVFKLGTVTVTQTVVE